MTTDSKYLDKINEAIKEARKAVYDDNFYNGSFETENKAYRYVSMHLISAENTTPSIEVKEVIRAIRKMVLADISNAGDEVRRKVV